MMEDRLRKRQLMAATSSACGLLCLSIALALPANAGGSLTAIGSGSSAGITASWTGVTGPVNLYFCPPSVASGSCTVPNPVSYFATNLEFAPGSPRTYVVGTSVGVMGGGSIPLPAGEYRATLWDGVGGPMLGTIVTTIGSGSSGGAGESAEALPAPIVQQFAKPVTGTCADAAPTSLNWSGVSSGGWGESWAQWPKSGTGGPVCTRTLTYSSSRSAWVVG